MAGNEASHYFCFIPAVRIQPLTILTTRNGWVDAGASCC
jgi:hypothetical protein